MRGGLCLPCNLREKNLYNYDPNAYSSNNSNYFPQPQDENYLCNLCGNNSHDGYDYQQQFPFVYEQEPSYNQNYDDNYYPHESPSFPCCDYCGRSHETFQCQPDNQNVDFSEQPAEHGNRSIQSLQNFKVIHKSSISFKKTSQISSVHEVVPILSTKEPGHSLSMGYEHLSITPETESDEVIESNAENLLPIPKILKFDFGFEEEIRLIENLLYDNLFPRPPEELSAENADTIIESIPLPIPVQDGDIRFLEELLIDDSILSDELSDAIFEENLSIPRPPPKPPDIETNAGEEITVVMIDKDKFDDDY
nr:hypothetical protein [Tanacetum cinerariifolium]